MVIGVCQKEMGRDRLSLMTGTITGRRQTPTEKGQSERCLGQLGEERITFKTMGGQIRDPQEGEKLSNMHTVYRNGKRDGILECEKPAEDLLLHSLLKSTKVCTTATTDFMAASACRKPAEYAFWLQNYGTAHGFNVGSADNSFVYHNSGRVSGSESEKKCTCTADEGTCLCGFLARTSRLVVGAAIGADGIYARADYPYKPHWIDDITETDTWCKDINGGTDKAHKPRRVCRLANLEKTVFWQGKPITLDNNNKIPDALEQEELKVSFVRRPNTAFNRAEFKHMENCVNSDDGQVCTDVPDLIQGLAIVGFKATPSTVRLLKAVEEDFNCATAYSDLQGVAAFTGFQLQTQYLVFNENNGYDIKPEKLSGDTATKVCELADNNLSDPDKDPGVWNVDLSSDGTIPLEHVQDKIDTYELLKITQCLEGSQSCPKITTSKRMNAGIPSTCQKPMISYVCDEETPNGFTIKEPGSMISMEAIANPSNSTVLRYTHEIGIACLNRINFFITCDDYTDERPALHSSLCTGADCSLPTNFKMCHYNPLSDILGENEHRLFRATFDPARFSGSEDPTLDSDCTCDQAMAIFSKYKKYERKQVDDALIEFSIQNLGKSPYEAYSKRCEEVGGTYSTCAPTYSQNDEMGGITTNGNNANYPGCGACFVCATQCRILTHAWFQTWGNKCYVDGLEQSSYPRNLSDTTTYAAHICTSEYRRVELRDYRPNVGLQVAYGACDSLRVKYAAEVDFQDAVVEPARGFAARRRFPRRSAGAADAGGERAVRRVGVHVEGRPPARAGAQGVPELVPDDRLGHVLAAAAFRPQPRRADVGQHVRGVPREQPDLLRRQVHVHQEHGRIPLRQLHVVCKAPCPGRSVPDRAALPRAASWRATTPSTACALCTATTAGWSGSTDDFGLFVEEPFTAVENGVDGIFLCMSPEAEQFISRRRRRRRCSSARAATPLSSCRARRARACGRCATPRPRWACTSTRAESLLGRLP